jgi:hypothetical protein
LGLSTRSTVSLRVTISSRHPLPSQGQLTKPEATAAFASLGSVGHGRQDDAAAGVEKNFSAWPTEK